MTSLVSLLLRRGTLTDYSGFRKHEQKIKNAPSLIEEQEQRMPQFLHSKLSESRKQTAAPANHRKGSGTETRK
jgi:hypothetical protein